MISQCSQSSYLHPELSCLLPEWFSSCYTTYACDITTWAWQLHISSLVVHPVCSPTVMLEWSSGGWPPAGRAWSKAIWAWESEEVEIWIWCKCHDFSSYLYLHIDCKSLRSQRVANIVAVFGSVAWVESALCCICFPTNVSFVCTVWCSGSVVCSIEQSMRHNTGSGVLHERRNVSTSLNGQTTIFNFLFYHE